MQYGLHMIGTVQKKRKGIPFSWKPDHGQRQIQQRGEFESLTSLYTPSVELMDDVYYTFRPAWRLGAKRIYPTYN